MHHTAFSLRFLLLTICILSGLTTTAMGELRIRFIEPKIIDETAFKRISEYFSEGENTGNKVIMRTDPESRSGLYFIVTLNQLASRIPEGSTITLDYYHADSLRPFTHTFEYPYAMAQGTLALDLHLGVTGEDQPAGGPTSLVAWHAKIQDKEGVLLAEEGSYLWSKEG